MEQDEKNLKSFSELRCLMGNDTRRSPCRKVSSENHFPPLARQMQGPNARLDKSNDTMTFEPQFSARNIQYEVSSKTGAISCGGIGSIHMLDQASWLGRGHRSTAAPVEISLALSRVRSRAQHRHHPPVQRDLFARPRSCSATTRTISTLSALAGFPIRPRPATFAVASRARTSLHSSILSTKRV